MSKTKIFTILISISFPVFSLIFLTIFYIFAWTEPTQAPPGGNVPAPLNVSALHQIKLGALSVTTLFDTNNPAYFIDPSAPISAIFSGNVAIGTTTPPLEKLDVAGAIRISDTPSPCDASRRGTIKFISGAPGTTDCLAVCLRRADGTFAWTCIDVGFEVGGIRFKYRRPITISNPTSTLTDFQILVTLNTASLIAAKKMRSDCADIRFTDSDGLTLLAYTENSHPPFDIRSCNSPSTQFFVKVPSIPPGTKTIYIYYGNPLIGSGIRPWDNVKHLNISGGVFNYNASLGVGGFHSREMQHRLGVAAGGAHTCALLTNGNVDCWGWNSHGQAADYTGGNAIGVDGGVRHTCALLANGNIDCWGCNYHGQAADYTKGDAIAVAAGGLHTCALLTNGNIDCWGNNHFGQAADYTGGNAIGVDGGYWHTCALLTNGNIDCWGYNYWGQAADYTGGNAIGVAAGHQHTCALLANGNIDCWGCDHSSSHGQCADYFGGNAIAVTGKGEHNCALLSSSNLDCWGRNLEGQAVDYFGRNVLGIAAEMTHTCILLSNGNIDCWGCIGHPGIVDFGQCTDYFGGNARNPFRKYVSPEPTTSVGPEESLY